jgi:hypothetical protein
MQNVAYGTYINGQIVLKEAVPEIEKADVVIVFLNESQQKSRLSDIFDLYGAWEDSRNADETIDFIRDSRTERAVISL